MPDMEKVIKGLGCCLTFDSPCGDCPYYSYEDVQDLDCERYLLHDAISMLKEHNEPKQIIRKQCKREHPDGAIEFFAEWYCPHCNMLILRGFDNPSIKFCYKCGKPILWEGR